MERDMGTRRGGHIMTFEQLQGISHAGLYCMSRHDCWWTIPVPGRERAAGIPITVSPRTCLHVLVLFCPTGSTGELLRFPLHAPMPSLFHQHDGAGCSTFQPVQSVRETQGTRVVKTKLVHYISGLAAAERRGCSRCEPSASQIAGERRPGWHRAAPELPSRKAGRKEGNRDQTAKH